MKNYYFKPLIRRNTRKRKKFPRCKSKKVLKHLKKGTKKCNRHHLINKCSGGKATLQNLLIINIYRHRAWHGLFQNLNIDQIINYLSNRINDTIINDYNWTILFRTLNIEEAIALLKRVKRAKQNQTR